MSELKTKPNDQNVEAFLNSIPDEKKRQDSLVLLELFRQVSGAEPRMWGDSIVGFGDYHYHYASGRAGDWFQVGFSPRKQNLTLYLMGEYIQNDELMQRLGKHKTGKGCLYINKLEDVDLGVLRQVLRRAIEKLPVT